MSLVLLIIGILFLLAVAAAIFFGLIVMSDVTDDPVKTFKEQGKELLLFPLYKLQKLVIHYFTVFLEPWLRRLARAIVLYFSNAYPGKK